MAKARDRLSAELITELLRQATHKGTRSTALQPACWGLAILLSGLLATVAFDAPGWLSIILLILLCLLVLLFLTGYLYFMINDPDALRSEKFTLQKLVIEKGLVGDSSYGVIGLRLGQDILSLTSAGSEEAHRKEPPETESTRPNAIPPPEPGSNRHEQVQ